MGTMTMPGFKHKNSKEKTQKEDVEYLFENLIKFGCTFFFLFLFLFLK
jgi:hypothetical protein